MDTTKQQVLAGLCLFYVVICLVGAAHASGDLLEQKAFQTEKLTSSVMMDVARAGDRLVAVGERGIIMFSDDHGLSWSQAEVPVRVTLTAVTFTTPETGWAVGHDTVVLKSVDRGQSWTKELDGTEINDLMVSSMEGLLETLQQELETVDEQGREDLEWALDDANANLRGYLDTQREGPTKPLMDVWFTSQDEGLIVGAFGIILKTTDGGRTWRALLDRIENPMGYHFHAIARTSDSLFLFGEAGMMFRSDDQGENWQQLEAVYEGSLFGAVADFEGKCVAAVGLRGSLVSSCDNGGTWAYQQLGSEMALNAVALLPGNQYAIVGMPESIFIGQGSIEKFQELSVETSAVMSAVDAGDGHLLLVGLGGIHRQPFDHK